MFQLSGFVMDFYWNFLAKETLDNNSGNDILKPNIRRMSDKFLKVVIEAVRGIFVVIIALLSERWTTCQTF